VRRLGAVLVLLGVLCAGCFAVKIGEVEVNSSMSDAVDRFQESDLERQPFVDFTDWEWDRLYVFDMEVVKPEGVDRLVGEEVADGASSGGLFVYFQGEEVVQVNRLDGAFCTGEYTTTAYVRKGFTCWLHDDNFESLPL
jgi:hypothetical protein